MKTVDPAHLTAVLLPDGWHNIKLGDATLTELNFGNDLDATGNGLSSEPFLALIFHDGSNSDEGTVVDVSAILAVRYDYDAELLAHVRKTNALKATSR